MSSRAAGFDIGTNSTRFIILERQDNGRFLKQVEELAFTRTGEGLEQTGTISEAAITRTVKALQGFQAQHSLSGIPVKAFATAAFRRATNGQAAAKAIGEAIGTAVSILSTEDEAKAGMSAIEASFQSTPPEFAIIDVGGGSTEIIEHQDFSYVTYSMPVGAVTLTEKFFVVEEALTPRRRSSSKKFLLESLRSMVRKRRRPTTAFAIGGTATTIAQYLLGDVAHDHPAIHGLQVRLKDVFVLAESLSGLTLEEKLRFKCLPPGRADVALAGILTLAHTLQHLNAQTVTVSSEGILYGLLAEYLGK